MGSKSVSKVLKGIARGHYVTGDYEPEEEVIEQQLELRSPPTDKGGGEAIDELLHEDLLALQVDDAGVKLSHS